MILLNNKTKVITRAGYRTAQVMQVELKKMGKLLLSHRYNPLPLLRSHPGGVQEELVVKDLPTANIANISSSV